MAKVLKRRRSAAQQDAAERLRVLRGAMAALLRVHPDLADEDNPNRRHVRDSLDAQRAPARTFSSRRTPARLSVTPVSWLPRLRPRRPLLRGTILDCGSLEQGAKTLKADETE